MNRIYLLAGLLLVTVLSCRNPQRSAEAANQTAPGTFDVIAFGSCNDEDRDQKMWSAILENRPDLWIWLGDNIYGDTHSMKVLREKYNKQKSHVEYQQFAASVAVIGTWDDHDYGINDGGMHYGKKDSSKQLMLGFLEVPETRPVWERDGVYDSYTFGEGQRQVKVILLDTRYFRDTLVHSNDEGVRYTANPGGDVLGEAQWQWLESELTGSDAAVHLIVSSIQVIPEEHGWEKWANFPTARQRLLDLLVRTKPSRPLILSGDRHIAEISKMEVEGLPQPLYDFTSSGLTHTWSSASAEDNKWAVEPKVIKRNFGIIKLLWDEEPFQLVLQVRGLGNSLFQEVKINY